jgi:hypothetical protein
MTSPIELQLIAALRRFLPDGVALHDFTAQRAVATYEPETGILKVRATGDDSDRDQYGAGDEEWSLYASVKFDSYRIDMILDTGFAAVAIECDGHDHHEKTKQQAAYDKSRDRWLLARGLPTVRFTGSEIFHSSERCVSDLLEVVAYLNRQSFALAHSGFSNAGIPFKRGDG